MQVWSAVVDGALTSTSLNNKSTAVLLLKQVNLGTTTFKLPPSVFLLDASQHRVVVCGRPCFSWEFQETFSLTHVDLDRTSVQLDELAHKNVYQEDQVFRASFAENARKGVVCNTRLPDRDCLRKACPVIDWIAFAVVFGKPYLLCGTPRTVKLTTGRSIYNSGSRSTEVERHV